MARMAAQAPQGTDLHSWSVTDPAAFWTTIWHEFSVIGEPGSVAWQSSVLPEAVFFPEAHLNLAENLLERGSPDDISVIVTGESEYRNVTRAELRSRALGIAEWLTRNGVTAGDRVGMVLPANEDAVTLTLACLTIGAIPCSAAPEFGAEALLDRFAQLEPTVLAVAPSYVWAGRTHDRAEVMAAVAEGLPSATTLLISGDGPEVRTLAHLLSRRAHQITDIAVHDGPWEYARFGFDHPAYILFSSGTTGRPKCLVHRAGGILLKHLVEIGLHADVTDGDRLLFFTTTGWMMWNWQLSALALNASIVLYDGSPTHPAPTSLIDAAIATRATHLGVGARLVDHWRSTGDYIGQRTRGTPLRMLLTTGSPLSVPSAQWLADELGSDVMINPISGGTDLVGCFVAGDPTRPFFAGEMTGPVLGCAVDVLDDTGARAPDNESGELACLAPFPTVPLGIWGDEDGQRLRSSYFDRFDGVWIHGDRAVRSARGGIAITGRSDATLNIGGVRMGTAEIYAALADLPEIAELLAFAQEWDGDTRIVLLVVTADAGPVSPQLQEQIRQTIRTRCSPRHMPALIVGVPDLPRTRTGKLSELAAREAVHGRDVAGIGALANPEVLDVLRTAVREA